jgi:DegV family protein with EDD domain
MRDYAILTDTSCDLPDALAKELGLTALPLTVSIGTRAYHGYLDWREMSVSDFYGMLRASAVARTSAVAPFQFAEAYEEILASGRDILVISLASALSATAQNAREAAEEAARKHGCVIELIDSRSASLGEGLLVYLAARAKWSGMALMECADYVRDMIPRVCHWFTVGDPRYLKRGGRLSASAAQEAGEKLHIMPVMRMDEEGRLVGAGRVRGRRAAIRALAEKVQQEAEGIAEQTVFISHGDCAPDAEELKTLVLRAGAREVIVGPVGPVIGAHAGPDTLAIFFIGKTRS